jgi:hypothetical protein
VIGDAEDVEAGCPVHVDQLTNAEDAVAPGRVRVELAEEGVGHVSSVAPASPSMGIGSEAIWSRTGDDRVSVLVGDAFPDQMRAARP